MPNYNSKRRDAQQQQQKEGCQQLPCASNSRNADVVVPSTPGTPATAVTPAKVGAPTTKFTGENIVFNLEKNSFRKGANNEIYGGKHSI
jgi:hypothetical protein